MYQILYILTVASDQASMIDSNQDYKYILDNKISVLSLINWFVDLQCMQEHYGIDQASLF